MDIYYQPDIFLVSGMPSNGKTNFAIGYCKEKSNTSIIHIDEVFLLMRDLFPEEDDIQKNLDIYKYVNHSSFDKQQFLKLFVIELGKAFRCMNFYKSLIIEGYICDKLHDDMKKIISDMGYKNIYEVVANRTCDGYMITLNKTCMGITKNFYYGNIVNAIDNFLAERKNIKNKVTYQKFPWHDLTNINSNSDIKYEASLKNVSLFQKSFLDVGCNTGYFCFKAKAAGAKKVVGVDAGSNWIELAYDINKYFFNYNDIFFLNCSVFDVDFPHKFDVVFCASVFHYFGDKQQEFINKMYDVNVDGGTFFFEVELSPRTDIDCDHVIRGNDTNALTYPTRTGFMKMIDGKYEIEKEAASYKQPGCLYDRTFFTLRKI